MSSPKFTQTSQFKKLNKEWQKKLKDSGFKDIEDKNEELIMNSFHQIKGDNKNFIPVLAEQKQEYYRMATHFLEEYTFESKLEKEIWRLHSEGLGYRPIINQLSTSKHKLYLIKMHLIVNSLKTRMFKLYGVTKD